MSFSIGLAIFGFIWHLFAVAGLILLTPYGKKWEGFYMGLLLGPVGLWLSFIIKSNLDDKGENL
jgi:hypothetical protein